MAPTLADLRRIFFGAGADQSVSDAEWEYLQDANTDGISGVNMLDAARTNEKVWIGANDLSNVLGAASFGFQGLAGNRIPAANLDPAAEEAVGTSLFPPVGWSSIDVELWWSNAGAGAGDVMFRGDTLELSDAESSNANVAGPNVTVTAPAQYVIEVTTLLTALTVNPNDLFRLNIVRVAANAADTLANDVAILGVMLRKR